MEEFPLLTSLRFKSDSHSKFSVNFVRASACTIKEF